MKRFVNITGVFITAIAAGLAASVALPADPPASPPKEKDKGAAAQPDSLPPGVLYQLGNTAFRGSGHIGVPIFSPDGKQLVASVAGDGLNAWSLETGQVVKRLDANSPIADRLWFAGQPPELHCLSRDTSGGQLAHEHWSYPDWTALPSIPATGAEKAGLYRDEFSGERLRAHSTNKGPVRVEEIASGAELLSVPQGDRYGSPKLSPDEKLLFISWSDNNWDNSTLEVWDIDQKTKRFEWKTRVRVERDLAVTPDGRYLAAALSGYCWDLRNGAGRHCTCACDDKKSARGSPRISPDGKLAAVAVDDEVRVFEVPSCKQLYAIKLGDYPWGITLSPDGKLIATSCGSQAIVFEFSTGRELFPRQGHMANVVDVEYSRDGKRLASVDWPSDDRRRRIAVWDLRKRQTLGTVAGADNTMCATLSADGRFVIVKREESLPSLWQVDRDDILPHGLDREPPPLPAAVSTNGAYLVAERKGSLFLTRAVLELRPGVSSSQTSNFRGHLGRVLGVAVSADAMAGASIGDDRTVRIWKPDAANEATKINLSDNPSPCISLSPDGSLVAAAAGAKLLVWKSNGGAQVATIDLGADQPTIVRFTPDAKTIAWGTKQGGLRVADAATGRTLYRQEAHPGGVSAIAFSPDGSHLFSGGADGQVRDWNSTTLEKLGTVDHGLGAVNHLVTFTDGKRLTGCDSKGGLMIWDTVDRKRLHVFETRYPSVLLAVSANGDELATLNAHRGGDRFDLKKLERVGNSGASTTTYVGPYQSVAVSPDSKLVAKTIPAGVRVWQIDNAKIVHEAPTPVSLANAIVFSPNGLQLAAGGDGFCVWSLPAMRPIRQAGTNQTGNVGQLVFSPSNRYLVVNGRQVWDMATGEMVRSISLPSVPGSRATIFAGAAFISRPTTV